MKYIIIVALAVFFLVAFFWPTYFTVDAQSKPFSVYRSGDYCVFVSNGQGGIVDIEIDIGPYRKCQ